MDRDFLQSPGRLGLRQIDNQPVGIGHELSAWGDRLACRDLDAKIVSVTGYSYAANGGRLLASMNQLHATAEQNNENQHFQTKKAANSILSSLESQFHSPSPFHKAADSGVANFIITTRRLSIPKETHVLSSERY